GAGPAVHRPGLHKVRTLGEVCARVDVPVLGGDDGGVLAVTLLQELGEIRSRLGAAGHRQRPTFAEVVLNIDDDQFLSHVSLLGAVVPDQCRWSLRYYPQPRTR